MKKLNISAPLLSLIIGTLILLFALTIIGLSTASTIISIFGIVIGISYIAFGIIAVLDINIKALEIINSIVYISAFPLFMFVYYLTITIVNAAGLSPTAWILSILLLISASLIVVLDIVGKFVNEEILFKIKRLAIMVFIGLLVVLLVFPINGGIAAIGDVLILDVLYIVCYFLIVKLTINDENRNNNIYNDLQ
ncbi:MAG: hypothetical protein IJS58_03990 [Bacilli bacterium]|nr:hypothetical protein [Bacilli bacterium]